MQRFFYALRITRKRKVSEMPITEILTKNAELYGDEVALVEINPSFEPESRITWREYSLMQPQPGEPFRREITWKDFEKKANRFANLLLSDGVIAQCGKHEELLEEGGVYKQLFDTQFGWMQECMQDGEDDGEKRE